MARSQLILDRYRVIGQAGAGGYGTVVHAYDTHLKRDVAIKCIELSEDEVARARLVALEARMAADLEDEAADAFPNDPDFIAARDGRRSGGGAGGAASGSASSSAARATSGSVGTRAASAPFAAGEVPPWEEMGDPVPDGDNDWDELIPWGASTADFPGDSDTSGTGRAASTSASTSGSARLNGRVRKTRHAPEAPYEPETYVEGVNPSVITLDAEDVDVRHLRGVRASRVIAPEEPEEIDLFEHIPGLEEARSVAKLSDSNIVTVYDCAVEEGNAYVIMEYVEGKTLAEIIDEVDDNITLDVVAAVFAAVSHALEVAHGENTLHLDIKPENVIVDGKGTAKVTDFGLAALMDASGFGTTGGGTIGYMPLEQMRQEPLDVRTDEWALASLTYEMLTGSNPFFAPTLAAAERIIEDAELVLPSLCWDELDAEADDIMFTALDPEKEERFEDVATFADALAPHLGNPKKGKRVLADIVNGNREVPEEELKPAEPLPPLPPLVDRLGLRGAAIVGHLFAAAGVAMLAAAGMANLHLTPGSDLGLATDAPIAYWAVVAICALVALIRPPIGVLFGYAALAVGLAGAGAWIPLVVLVIATAVWWRFVGCRGTSPVVAALMQPLFGSFGFAAFTPVTCGVLLPTIQSAATAAFAFVVALLMAGCGSIDIMNWDAIMHLGFSSNPQAGCVAVASQPGTWLIGLSWVVAATLYSLCCVRGIRAFDILGSVLSAVALMVGVCAAAHFTNFGGSWLPNSAALLGALVPGVLGILAALMNLPDRARWATEEWYVEAEE